MASDWKIWCPEFSGFRKIKEVRLSELKKKLNADEEDLRNLFILSGNKYAPLEVEVLAELCRGTSLRDVKAARGSAGTQRVVWIDERNGVPDLKGRGDARQHDKLLTATGLLRALEIQRFGHEELPDAARRLIYIADGDPACIQALAATISTHQARVARNAIYQYLQFQTLIAVKIHSGFLSFQLDLHLPFFILRKSTTLDEVGGKSHLKPWRRWIDLSFLKLEKFDREPHNPKEVWGIQEVQFSLVVAGPDHFRWNGYGLVDSEIDGILAESFDDDLPHDQIAAGDLQANFPIWTPRDYWIRVFEIRIGHVRNHWDNLIRKLELGINQYVRGQSQSTLSNTCSDAGC
jgi:hypothetical protein